MALRDGYTVEVEGVRELDRALRRADREARKSLRAELKAAAGVVAAEAQAVAAARGLGRPGRSGRGAGRLVRSIKPGLQGSGAVVRVGANRAGYPYPAVYEFGRGGARAFLRPAAERKQGEVRERAEDAMQAAIRKAGLA